MDVAIKKKKNQPLSILSFLPFKVSKLFQSRWKKKHCALFGSLGLNVKVSSLWLEGCQSVLWTDRGSGSGSSNHTKGGACPCLININVQAALLQLFEWSCSVAIRSDCGCSVPGECTIVWIWSWKGNIPNIESNQILLLQANCVFYNISDTPYFNDKIKNIIM